MATIGSLNLKLGVNPEAFTSGLAAAQKGVKSFVGTNLVQFKRLFNVGGMVEDLFNETFGSILQSDSVFTRIDEIAKLADNLNISTEALTGFQHAANLSGVANADLQRGLETMLRVLGNATTITETAGASLAKFGINAEELARLPTDQIVFRLAKRFNELDRGAERSAFAMAAFGKSGIKMQKFLENGEKGLKAIRDEADKLGLTFSRGQAFGVETARDSVTRLESIFEGIKRTLAIEFAPLISSIGDMFMGWIDRMGGVQSVFKQVARAIVTLIAKVGTAIQKVIKYVIDLVKEIKDLKSVGEAVKPTNFIAGGLIGARAFLFGAPDAPVNAAADGAKNAQAPFVSLNDILKQTLENIDNFSIPIKKVPAGAALLKDITKLEEGLLGQINGFKQSTIEMQIMTLAQKGATDGQLEFARSLQETLSQMKEFDDAQKRGQAVFQQTRNPMEQFNSRIEELRKLLHLGTIDMETFERAAQAAGKSFDSSFGQVATPAAIQAGTAEAFSRINRAQREVARNPNANVEKILNEEKAIQQKQLKELVDLGRNLAKAVGVGDLLPP